MALKDTLKILVVDDTSTSRGLLTQALEAMGFVHVDTATDGRSALRALHRRPAHLVLSDFFMPDMDGIALLQAIRGNPVTQSIGFILVTGRATPEVVRSGRQLGMNNLLRKPFTAPELRSAMEAVLGRL